MTTPDPEARCPTIAAIRERATKATKGPWTYEDDDEGDSMGWVTAGSYSNRDHKTMFDVNGDSAQQAMNAEFVAHAREDIPYLLDALASASALLREAAAMLRDREWDKSNYESSWCGSCSVDQDYAHKRNCAWKKLLTRIDRELAKEA